MKHRLPTFRSAAFLLFAFFLLALLLTNGEIAMDGVRRGLSLCMETLIPSLFPFLVISELLISLRAGDILGRLFNRPLHFLFGVSGNGASSLLLGVVCGFPVGTATAVSLYEKQSISKKELQRLILFANNPSSGFLISAVGEALFGSKQVGVALFIITLFSAATVGTLLRLWQGPVVDKSVPQKAAPPIKKLCAADFTGSVKRGFFTMLQVTAFVLFFSCVAECLAHISAISALPDGCRVSLFGFLELTAGISAAVTTFSPAVAFRFCAFFAGFSGLSVCLQIFSVTEGKELRVWPYLLTKTVQGALCLLFAELYLRLFRPTLSPTQNVWYPVGAYEGNDPFLIPLMMLLLLLLFLAFCVKVSLVRKK